MSLQLVTQVQVHLFSSKNVMQLMQSLSLMTSI